MYSDNYLMTLDSFLCDLVFSGAERLGISLSGEQVCLLVEYIELLDKWNKTYNLTAVRDPSLMVSRHIMDSLSILPYIKSKKILDVGSGAGLPGIPLGVVCPEKHISTLDSNGKKTRFITQVKSGLGLKNLTVVNSRVELYQPVGFFDEVVSRAFSSLADMVEKTRHLLDKSGVYLAMKGLYPERELEELARQTGCELVECVSLNVLDSDEVRHLVILRNGS